MKRRDFLFLSAVFTAGCATTGGNNFPTRERIVNAGPASQYLADGVYSRFRYSGFFIVRRGGELLALSAICTHRRCKLEAESEKTFSCPCHGSTFDADGHVTKGPARRDLPVYEISTNEKGELLVKIAV